MSEWLDRVIAWLSVAIAVVGIVLVFMLVIVGWGEMVGVSSSEPRPLLLPYFLTPEALRGPLP